MNHDKHVTYTTYLKVDELLELQQPLSEGPEHDELAVHHNPPGLRTLVQADPPRDICFAGEPRAEVKPIAR
jgi:hypothetical protein